MLHFFNIFLVFVPQTLINLKRQKPYHLFLEGKELKGDQAPSIRADPKFEIRLEIRRSRK